jgi:hypothetical protein
LADPRAYGAARDRVFAYVRLGPRYDRAVAALEKAGQPVVEIRLEDAYDLGGEFMRWEIATAAAGWLLEIDPFDQPNVQESKDNTVRLLKEHEATGQLPGVEATLWPSTRDFSTRLLRHLKSARKGDYVALTVYCQRTPRREKQLRDLQAAIRDRFHVATTLGFGPRFLHSTGQLHKGGANNGVFVQFTVADPVDVPVPGDPFTFSVLKQAQALGDFQALQAHGRRAVRVEVGSDIEADLRRVLASVTGAARPAAAKKARPTRQPVAQGARRALGSRK